MPQRGDMQTALGREVVFYQETFLFRVSTRLGDMFMRVDQGHSGDRRAVVEVDSGKFLHLWRNEPYSIHSDVSSGSPDTWPQDRKFHYASQGFAGGRSNPVPLADVECGIRKEYSPVIEKRLMFLRRVVGYTVHRSPYVAIGDGITRTIWLLTHGATHFPVVCSVEAAERLQSAAGLEGGSYRTVATLFE